MQSDGSNGTLNLVVYGDIARSIKNPIQYHTLNSNIMKVDLFSVDTMYKYINLHVTFQLPDKLAVV